MGRSSALAIGNLPRRAALAAAGLWALAALAEGTPRLAFDRTVIDFGKTSQVESVAGVFKFTNTGDAILKLEPPKPSCGCTIAGLKPDTLKPGESGELAFTLNLGRSRAIMEKHIAVKSNDPQTPDVNLTIKVDYTPLYDVSPTGLTPTLPLGVAATNQFVTLTRTDGKPVPPLVFSATKPWITAAVEPGAGATESTARIRIDVRRDGVPRHFNEYVYVYTADKTNSPVSTLFLYGHVMGEVSLSPEALYWNVMDAAKLRAERPEAQITRRVVIRSATGRPLELKNPQSTLKGIQVQLVPKEPGKVYELVATLQDVPDQTLSGNVSFETSVADQAKIDLPVIVNVFKP